MSITFPRPGHHSERASVSKLDRACRPKENPVNAHRDCPFYVPKMLFELCGSVSEYDQPVPLRHGLFNLLYVVVLWSVSQLLQCLDCRSKKSQRWQKESRNS